MLRSNECALHESLRGMPMANVAEQRMSEGRMPMANVAEQRMCFARMPEANVAEQRMPEANASRGHMAVRGSVGRGQLRCECLRRF